MHKSTSGGEPDAQTKVHLEVNHMHKRASGGAQSASGGAQMSHEYGDSGPLSSAQRDLLRQPALRDQPAVFRHSRPDGLEARSCNRPGQQSVYQILFQIYFLTHNDDVVKMEPNCCDNKIL